MELIIERAELRRACAAIAEVVKPASVNTIPILACVVIDCAAGGGGTFTLRGTDMDRWLDVEATAEVAAGGAVAVPADRLRAIAEGAPDGAQIRLRLGDGGRMTVTAGRARFTLPTLAANELPSGKAIEAEAHDIDMKSLRRLLDRCRHAMSAEETRYYLNGVYLHGATNDQGAEELVAAATDGHRLAFDRVRWDGAEAAFGGRADADGGVILPTAAVATILKLFGAAATVEIKVAPRGRIEIKGGGIAFASRLIDGTFPDYARVTPARAATPLVVARKDLEQMVTRLRPMAEVTRNDGKVSLPLLLHAGDGVLVVRAGSAADGIARDEMAIDWPGERIELGVNAAYLIDACKALGGERLTVSLIDGGSPIRIETDAAPEAYEVLMPMRVSIPDIPE